MRTHQVLVTASPDDAVTNRARSFRTFLDRLGPSDIYAWNVDPSLRAEVRPLPSLAPSGPGVLVFHAAIGPPAVYEFLRSRPETLVLVHYNLPAPEHVAPYDPALAGLLELGRVELASLQPRVAGVIAASAYSAAELEASGYRNVRVVTPGREIARLRAHDSDPATVTWLQTLQPPVVLCVASLMPQKRIDLLLEMMYVAQTYHGLAGTLLLVGRQPLDGYTRAIREQLRQLNSARVGVMGPVRDGARRAMFEAAAVVVTASEHEGFCLPLVEAMAFDTPVLARGCAAVPETVGDAGVLLAPEDGATMFAQATAELLSNLPLQEYLAGRGRARAAGVEASPSDDVFLEVVRGAA